MVRNRDFGLLWGGQLLSSAGNWLMIVAVPVYVFHLTGSAWSTGLAVVAETVPALVLAPLAGALVDRWDRRHVMIASDALRALTILALLAVDDRSLLWLLYAVVFAEKAIGQFFQPAHRALIPALVGRAGELETANSWYSVASGLVRLAGGPVGGALYLTIGFSGLVLLDAATYAVSALVLLRVRVPVGAAGDSAPGRGAILAGAAFLLRTPVLRGLLAVSALFLLGNGALTVLLVPYAVSRLGASPAQVGLLMSALGAGYLGSAYVGARVSRGGRLRAGVVACLVAVTACFVGLFDWPAYPAALVFIGLAGVPGGALLMVVQVQVQRHSPDRVIGRVSSAFAAGEMAATVVGALLGSALARPLGLVPTANLVLAVLVAAVAVAAAALPTTAAVDLNPPARAETIDSKD